MTAKKRMISMEHNYTDLLREEERIKQKRNVLNDIKTKFQHFKMAKDIVFDNKSWCFSALIPKDIDYVNVLDPSPPYVFRTYSYSNKERDVSVTIPLQRFYKKLEASNFIPVFFKVVDFSLENIEYEFIENPKISFEEFCLENSSIVFTEEIIHKKLKELNYQHFNKDNVCIFEFIKINLVDTIESTSDRLKALDNLLLLNWVKINEDSLEEDNKKVFGKNFITKEQRLQEVQDKLSLLTNATFEKGEISFDKQKNKSTCINNKNKMTIEIIDIEDKYVTKKGYSFSLQYFNIELKKALSIIETLTEFSSYKRYVNGGYQTKFDYNIESKNTSSKVDFYINTCIDKNKIEDLFRKLEKSNVFNLDKMPDLMNTPWRDLKEEHYKLKEAIERRNNVKANCSNRNLKKQLLKLDIEINHLKKKLKLQQ